MKRGPLHEGADGGDEPIAQLPHHAVLPLLIFLGLGSFLFRRMQKKMGKDAMSFGGGGFGMAA